MTRPSKNGEEPDGEWVELYNLSENVSVDVAGWIIRDARDDESHAIEIESCRTEPSGSTEITARGFLVVYFKSGKGCGSKGFQLNPKDVLRLFDGSGNLVDSFQYPPEPCEGSLCKKTGKDVTYSRIPDGEGEWALGMPTPGVSNRGIPEESQDLAFGGTIPDSSSTPALTPSIPDLSPPIPAEAGTQNQDSAPLDDQLPSEDIQEIPLQPEPVEGVFTSDSPAPEE